MKKDNKKKSKGEQLAEKLLMKKSSIWESADKKKIKHINAYAKRYIDFLNLCKTEREAVDFFFKEGKKSGFKDAATVKKIQPGSKLFFSNRGKSCIMAIVGKQPLSKGIRLIASHIDSPRLDLKQNPLYEDTDIALVKTQYYGGIRKYHWVNIPLAIHGVIVKKNGSTVNISIGDGEDDPVFLVSDLLPHLGRAQGDKKASEFIKGEDLNIIVGSMPFDDEKVSDKVKLNILNILHKTYGIIEEDFASAEIEVVPATKARFAGFDKSMIAGYGQDDRICAYAAFEAICKVPTPEYTTLILHIDKEEIGSEGNTSMNSVFLETVLGTIMKLSGQTPSGFAITDILSQSKAISSDVNAAVNPTFKEVHELSNASFMNKGIVLTKYTGYGGKYAASDASAEFVGEIRKILTDAKVPWQSGSLGKVDEGGGGTIAKYLTVYGMDVLDAGPAILGMHSPYELSGIVDAYATYEAYVAFIKAK